MQTAESAATSRSGWIAERTRSRHRRYAPAARGRPQPDRDRRRTRPVRNTIRRFARAADPDDLLVRGDAGRRTNILDRYEPYLRERWNSGCVNATMLRQEIRARGYPGSYVSVRSYLSPPHG